jgi:hypothetical protein
MLMFPIHNTFQREMAVIGRLLVDYGELELDLMNCVQVARSFDFNATLKAMFRVRGETNRIDIADGLGRPAYVNLKLEAEFDFTFGAMRHCLRIRNKYAHAFWHDPNMGKNLCYVSLEELAREIEEIRDLTALTFFFIDEGLLLQQERFFEYTRALINYVNHQGRYNSGALKQQIFPLPATVAQPQFFVRKS